MKKQAQEVYTTLVSGFDANVIFDEGGQTATVELFESGASAWEGQVSLESFADPNETQYTEDMIGNAAQAAVDLFEAERGTLGEGATALEVEGKSMRKKSFFEAMWWEDWYMSFKGSIFCDQATELLENYLDTFAPTEQDYESERSATYEKLRELEYRMDKLYFEKMKADPGGQTIIIINGNQKMAFNTDNLTTWLDAFAGHRLEPQAVALAKEYLDTEAKLNNLDEADTDNWSTREELRMAMEELRIQLLQANLAEIEPEEGPEVAPKMMNDMFELADGLDFDEPLQPIVFGQETEAAEPDNSVEMFTQMSAATKKALQKGIEDFKAGRTVGPLALEDLVKNAAEDEKEDRPTEPVEVKEMGQLADGLQIAEVPIDEHPFNVSERVELTKEYEQTLWGGIKRKLPKGSKGTIDDLYDRAGDFYMVRFDDGKLVKIPFDFLKRLKKGK
jgi:hypothetical protein